MDSNGIDPALHLRLAQAYRAGQPSIKPIAPPRTPQAVIDTFARTAIAPKVSRVVAGHVPGSIDFSASEPRPAGQNLAMYRHPADKNVAATRVNLGALIDLDA